MNDKFVLPVSILVAGILISGAVVYSTGKKSLDANIGKTVVQKDASGQAALEKIKPVGADDHIFGNVAAPVKIVEFSDTECPFCKNFDVTMKQIMNEYAGKVAWVYRHFPLAQLHPKAQHESVATECANEFGGSEKFWAYLNRIFEVTPSNNGLDPAELPKIATYIGLDATKFNECLGSTRYDKRIADDITDAANSGGRGTPYSIVIAQNGKKFLISGAQPYEFVKSVINLALAEK
ncbi:MAG: thioredoxin domain-containing protein [Candidatus Jorgensenbacteria bacterium]|nr:thioredoxin domain-containing protein [Candidatus Jorgensenbacteria bacterium]